MLISLIPLSLPFSTSDNEVTGCVGGWGTSHCHYPLVLPITKLRGVSVGGVPLELLCPSACPSVRVLSGQYLFLNRIQNYTSKD